MTTKAQMYLNYLGDQREIAALREEIARLRELLVRAREFVARDETIQAAFEGKAMLDDIDAFVP